MVILLQAPHTTSPMRSRFRLNTILLAPENVPLAGSVPHVSRDYGQQRKVVMLRDDKGMRWDDIVDPERAPLLSWRANQPALM